MDEKPDNRLEKSETSKREESVMAFWNTADIFKKSVEKEAPNGEFVFYDGPPFATGLPHMGHLLGSTVKDLFPRYKTMRGYRVRRRWGWDCHGLPIESLVEKKLGLKSKKDIEKLGVATFNEAARSMVLEYVHDWEKYIERIGRWVEFKNSYKTMDNSYIESVWWAFSKIHKTGRLYEGRKVLMYCPHCETPLAKAEIAMDNSYEEVTEEAVTVKFRVTNPEKIGLSGDVFLLAWTTTPWTLPGNVALAVDPEIKYGIYEHDGTTTVAAVERGEALGLHALKKQLTGKDLAGIEYEPLYEIERVKAIDAENKAWKVYPADFVSTEEGTGIVHTAVIYGEDDYQLGLTHDLPMTPLLNQSGRFNDDAPEFIRGKYLKFHGRGFPQAQKGEDAETFIKKDLEDRGLIFARGNVTHPYPHCYRCGTPLIYNAITSWFIDIQAVKGRMLETNENVNWVPAHLKRGRFQHIVENAPDWTISRNRYWASPLPIWKNEKTGEVTVIGSLEELKSRTKKSRNTYAALRHGEADHNIKNIFSSTVSASYPLTDKGKEQSIEAAERIADSNITKIYSSPFGRCLETTRVIRERLGLSESAVVIDNRLGEYNFGIYNERPIDEYLEWENSTADWFTDAPKGGESQKAAKRRFGDFLYDIEAKEQNENILIVTHAVGLKAFEMIVAGADDATSRILAEKHTNPGQLVELDFTPIPHNKDYELDLHRPYIDEVDLAAEDGASLRRTIEVVDCWVESSSMPFAEWHYPVENKEEFESRFPGDFIAEYIAQTRTWFYYMHTIAALLFDSHAFKNVVSTGTILAADGSKMSKSKGNYTDPLENIDRYGADALRYYMMSSVVMQAEDLRFRDEELREAHNRVVNILWNAFKFYDLYKDSTLSHEHDDLTASPHVLDRWIIARLNTLIVDVTEGMEAYDTVRASRPIAGFINDFSTWYVRRSRERFKGADPDDKEHALRTTRHVFEELSKVIAPIMPFLAESLYRGVGGEKESVHLEDWPAGRGFDANLLEDMSRVREIVSLALEARNTAGIKVRQPIASLKVKITGEKESISEEYVALIRDEVNVKEIIFDENLESDVWIDTALSLELKREGAVRDFMREVQERRKAANLTPQDLITIRIGTDAAGKALIESYREEFMKTVGAKGIIFEPTAGDPIIIEPHTFTVTIDR